MNSQIIAMTAAELRNELIDIKRSKKLNINVEQLVSAAWRMADKQFAPGFRLLDPSINMIKGTRPPSAKELKKNTERIEKSLQSREDDPTIQRYINPDVEPVVVGHNRGDIVAAPKQAKAEKELYKEYFKMENGETVEVTRYEGCTIGCHFPDGASTNVEKEAFMNKISSIIRNGEAKFDAIKKQKKEKEKEKPSLSGHYRQAFLDHQCKSRENMKGIKQRVTAPRNDKPAPEKIITPAVEKSRGIEM